MDHRIVVKRSDDQGKGIGGAQLPDAGRGNTPLFCELVNFVKINKGRSVVLLPLIPDFSVYPYYIIFTCFTSSQSLRIFL